MKKSALAKLISLLTLVIIAYLPTFLWMISRWSATETYYSHGFLVPLISGFVIWHKRKELQPLRAKPQQSGWLFFILGIAIHSLSTLWQVYFTSGFSLLLVLVGLVLLFLGKEFLRKLLFPILFLALMIPLPMLGLADLSFKLKILVTKAAVFIVNSFGVHAVNEGSIIRTARSYLIVEDPCSGIKSMIVLIGIGALIANYNELSRIKKVVVLLSSISFAFVANILRIAILSIAGQLYGIKFAVGLFHGFIGFLSFIAALIGILFVAKLLEIKNEK